MNAIGSWKWSDEVYRTNIILLICERADVPARVRMAVREPGVAEAIISDFGDPDSETSQACVVRGRYEGAACAVIWMQPSATVDIAAHEAFHVAAFVLLNVGIPLSRESEEAYAYFIEWLMRGIDDCASGGVPPAEEAPE